MRALVGQIILVSSALFLPLKNSARADCELVFSSNQEATSSPQEQIQKSEMAVKDLMNNYIRRLGPYHDPFALAFSPEQGDRIFFRLSYRLSKNGLVESPLSVINDVLKQVYAEKRLYDEALVDWIIGDAHHLLAELRVDRADLQSNLLALKYTMEYLRRHKEPEKIVDRDGAKPEESTPQKEKKKKQEAADQDQPPEYPELPKEYKPFTKDTQNQGDGKQKQHRVAEVNFKTPFFAQRYFTNIVRGASLPFQEASLPITLNQPSKFQQTGQGMQVRTFGKQKVDLFLPPGFKPLQPSDPRALISRSETGGYLLELNADVPEVNIPLTQDTNISMLSHVQEFFVRPVGFKAEEWPEEVQANIIRKFSAQDAKSDPLKVAQAIADHIASDYLYSVGARSETDPSLALKAGAFQCDMAAYAMVGLLRDVYQIPSRIVGGFRAKSYQSGKDGKSYLVVPGEAHAWVEVFFNGKWQLFDPTPVKKDKKDNQQGDSEYSDNALVNTPKPESEEQSAEAAQQPGSQDGENKKQDHQKRLKDDTEKRTSEVQKSENKDGDANELSLDDLANQLELGSLELEPKLDRNALLERAMRVLLQATLDPTQRGAEVQNRLNQVYSLIRGFNTPHVKQIVQKALSSHDTDHPELKNWLDQLVRLLPTQDLHTSYHELHKIQLALETYAQVLDRDGSIPLPERLVETLDLVRKNIAALAHPDSQDIGLVQDLVKNLPGVARQLLKQLYDFTGVGPNSPTRKIAKDLKAGKLNDLRLVSILSPLCDFILNSTPRPETIEVRTWQRDARRPRGQELLPLQRYSDISRALLGQPGKSVEENVREGTAFVPVRRHRIEIPAGHGKEEAERVTVVLYDTSGSMSGNPGRFQAGLISAFTTKALSDTSPSGRHRHRVVLVPFDTEPGTPIPVTDTADALDVRRHYQSKLKNTGGGTDIQKALLQAMSLIADAEKRAGEPLAAANIVLMTDGQAQVDTSELLKARRAIDRQTPLQTMFIAINQTNEELMRFAMDSQSMGAERGFYREFTAEHIKDTLHEADHLDLSGRHDFYTDKTASNLPPEVYQLLEESLQLAAEYSDQIFYGNQHASAREHLEELEELRWQDVKQLDRPLENWLIKVRKLAQHPVFKDKRLLEKVVDDLITHFERLTGTNMNSLSDFEQEQLRHLVRYAAGLEEGIW